MGQQSLAVGPDPSLYQFPTSEYDIKSRNTTALAVWKNKNSPYQQLIEFRMAVNSQYQLKKIYQKFILRYQHRFLVSTHYLSFNQEGVKGCGEIYKGSIYLQQPITNLSQINDIPFSDTLHMYSVAFNGFDLLYKQYGYFDIFEDMFYFNGNGKMKVWCNSAVYKLEPQPYLLDSNGQQIDMIMKILYIFDENSEKNSSKSVKDKIMENMRHGWTINSFNDIKILWRKLCRQNNWFPPQRMQCISAYGKQDIQKLIALQNSNMSSDQISIISQSKRNNLNKNYPINQQKMFHKHNLNTVRMPYERKNINNHHISYQNKIPTQKCINYEMRSKPLHQLQRRIHSPKIQATPVPTNFYHNQVQNAFKRPNTHHQHISPRYTLSPTTQLSRQRSLPKIHHQNNSTMQLFTFYNPSNISNRQTNQSRLSTGKNNVSYRPLSGNTVRVINYQSDAKKKFENLNHRRNINLFQQKQSEKGLKKIGKVYFNQKHNQPINRIGFNIQNPTLSYTKTEATTSPQNRILHSQVQKSRNLQKIEGIVDHYTQSHSDHSGVKKSQQKQKLHFQYTDPKLIEILHIEPDPQFNKISQRMEFSFEEKQIKNRESMIQKNYNCQSRSTYTIQESKYRPTVDSQIWADVLELKKNQ